VAGNDNGSGATTARQIASGSDGGGSGGSRATEGAATGSDQDRRGGDEPAGTPARVRHPLSRILATYDRLYAEIVGDRRVFDDPRHPNRQALNRVLAPGSPLRDPEIITAFPEAPGDPVHWELRAGTAGLRPGETNAELPLIHEQLGPLPDLDQINRDELIVPICNHLDYQIYDEMNRGIEVAVDVTLAGLATFHRVDGEWRLWEYRWQWDDPCARCGPEPEGTGHKGYIPVRESADIRTVPRAWPPCPAGQDYLDDQPLMDRVEPES
jgi:hypothetical protein